MICLQVLTLQQRVLQAARYAPDHMATPPLFRTAYGLRCWRTLLAILATLINGARFQSTPTF
jgi:hypothetical protein